MAAWLHSRGYYDVVGLFDYGSERAYSAVHWMNDGGRPDYISNPPDAHHIRAVGCAVAFLHFLHTQEQRSWFSIVNNLDATLAQTYTRLTGATDGFDRFRSLVDAVFPVGTDVDWPHENLFPLLDPARQTIDWLPAFGLVESSEAENPLFASDVLDEGEADARPSPICPGGRYRFEIRRVSSSGNIVATATGFGNPVFDWSIGGQSIDGSVSLPVAGWDDDARDSSFRRSRSEVVNLTAYSEQTRARWDGPASSTLTILPDDRPPNIPGHCTLPIELSVREGSAAGPSAASNTWTQLHLTRLIWEDAFYDRRHECEAWWHDELDRHQLLNDVPLVLTLPDPAPYLLWVAEWIRLLDLELRVVRVRAPDLYPAVDLALNALLGRAQRLE